MESDSNSLSSGRLLFSFRGMAESVEALLIIFLRDFFLTIFGRAFLSADETSGSGNCA